MRNSLVGLATLAAAATLSCVIAAQPAEAATATFSDQANDVRHGGDLRSVRIDNTAQNVRITIKTADLVADPASGVGGAVFFDTDGDSRPDLVAVGGFFDGTDYALLRTDSWNVRRATERVDCSYRMRLNYDTDTARFRIGRSCLASGTGSEAVRIEVRTSAGAGTKVDWLGTARRFTRPVSVG